MSHDLVTDTQRHAADLPRAIHAVGTIHIPQRGTDAFILFTPLGERAWAHGWDPIFPASPDDDSAPGTVFEVGHGSVRSTWIVCRREQSRVIQYARVIPDKDAGTITVTLTDDPDGTVVTVEYRLTAMAPEAAEGLARFASHYSAFLQEWETSIAAINGTTENGS